MYKRQATTAVLKLLLDCGVSVDARDEHGYTPLHFAVRANREDMVQLLLERGADINAKSYKGYSVLHCAVNFSQDMCKV